ncbi:MAG: hypothetical protein N2316_07565 [Spirochaetes bacterium]|nr:hypothetical protein [Spirochaetota bacterium]
MKSKIFIGLIILVSIMALIAYLTSRPDPEMMAQPKISQKNTIPSSSSGFFSSRFFSMLKRLFQSDERDLTEGSERPEYKALIDKIDKLYENFALLPPEKRDEKKLILDQAALVIDYQLGPNHPKKKEFLEIVGWSYDARQPLNQKYLKGEITRKEFFEKLEEHFREVGEKYAAIFTDEEYRAMFNMEKGESLGAAMGLTPEMAQALDERDKQTPPDNLRKEDYALSEDETMTPEQIRIFQKTYGDPPGFYPEPLEEFKKE